MKLPDKSKILNLAESLELDIERLIKYAGKCGKLPFAEEQSLFMGVTEAAQKAKQLLLELTDEVYRLDAINTADMEFKDAL